MSDIPFKVHDDIQFDSASLVVGWQEEVGQIGTGVIDYLRDRLDCRLLAEIEPIGYFPLHSVPVEDDIAEFPESKLYYCADKKLLLFPSYLPSAEWYRFLNALIDMTHYFCKLKSIYTLGGLVSLNTHIVERRTMAVVNTSAMKRTISRYDLDYTMDYETPDGQRPTLSSFLMWIARQRRISAASLWVPVPFYLSAVADPSAWSYALQFLDRRFKLSLDFTDLDEAISDLNEKIDRARADTPELDTLLRRLEASQTLMPDENDRLIKEIEDILKTDGGIE